MQQSQGQVQPEDVIHEASVQDLVEHCLMVLIEIVSMRVSQAQVPELAQATWAMPRVQCLEVLALEVVVP